MKFYLVRNLLSRFWRDGGILLSRIISNGINILFPHRCLACGVYLPAGSASATASAKEAALAKAGRPNKSNWSYYLCNGCFDSIPINSGFSCPHCRNRLPELKNLCHPEAKYVLAAATSYQNAAVRETIHALKYWSVKKTVETLTEIINLYLEKIFSHWSSAIGNSIIIPLPLHRRRERRRGFNQAFFIARAVAEVLHDRVVPELEVRLSKEVKLPKIETDILIKLKNTRSQTELKNEKRIENIQGSFGIKNQEKIAGKNIILVDDVFTSGATLNEAVRVLKSAGAKKIIAFVIARA
jgi:ComF family protein